MSILPREPVRRLVVSIHAHPYRWLLGVLLVTAAMAWAGQRLTLKSRLEDLLPESAPSVQAMQVLRSRLGNADSLVVTLMTADFNRVKPVLPEIAAALEAHPDIVTAKYRLDLSMIERNALIIFPTLEDLKGYYEELTETIKAAVKKRLALFDDGDEGGDDGPRRTYSWAELEDDDALSRIARRFRRERGQYREYFYNWAFTTIGLQVFPVRPSSDLKFARHILEVVDEIVRDVVRRRLGEVGPGQVIERIDLGGGYRGAIEEQNAIKDDLISSTGVSLGLLALVIIGYFRSLRAFVCVLAPLVIGTTWTVGLVALTVGYLNLITAFIFAVLLGLGIDFGIHFYQRYREERAAGHAPLDAMIATHLSCGEASLLASTTTAAGFLALTLADFRGFSQFGGVAAGGVMLCLLAVFVAFPAIAFIAERWVPLKLLGYRVDRDAGGEIPRGRFPLGKRFLLAGLAICLAAGAAAPAWLEFEYDFRKLGTKNEKKKEYEDIQYGTTQATAPAVIFARSAEEARDLYRQLEERTSGPERHPHIKSFQSLFSLVPDQQTEKRKVVRRLCRKLGRKVGLFEGDQREGADELLSHCDPEEITLEGLPDWVREKFTDKEGQIGEFIFVSPRGSVNDGKVALAFREEMLSLRGADGKPPLVSGKPMVWAEVLLAMFRDGKIVAAASLLVVVVLLFLFERRPSAVAIILLPLTCAFGVMLGAMALFGLKLNFFNMLAVPTVIGIGVDDGVHIYHRYRELGRGCLRYLVRTTGMAAVMTTLTTCIGFGSLMVANHLGLNSLGLLTVIGMVAALATVLTIMPAALQWRDDRRAASE